MKIIKLSDKQFYKLQEFIEKECDYVLNLWNKKELHSRIFGISKALGEGTMTIKALKYIIQKPF